ncbi:acyl-CoA dehydrogenase family protein [Tuberibacillus calidus]|jgi:hypothetical protein|uniref:acyl-CoA dehydrogenase family protein n=1 Tax=Tuberibacillus calidus TaxID=340097 RepID=UPI000403240A|nr:acyl-CoA dehydrogenase family protein [Tuberibacillus calidus]
MISFQPTDEEQSFAEMALDFAIKHIRPNARLCEKERTVISDIAQKAVELGFSTLELPESWAGLELPLISQVQIWQALSYGDLAVVQGIPGAGDAASLIRLDPDAPPLQAYKDLGMGRDSWPPVAFIDVLNRERLYKSDLTLTPSGSGYVLNGTSPPVIQARTAESAAIAAVDDQGEAAVLWLNHGGWQVKEGDFRLGLLAAGLGRLSFNEYHVGAEEVIARGQAALELMKKVENRIRVLQAAKEVGLMEAALNYVVEYTAGRKAFGQEIAKFQGVSFTVADMAFETAACRHLVWRAALKVEEEPSDSLGTSLSALYRAHKAMRFVTDSAVQLLGGHGYVQEYPAEKWMRDAQAQTVLYGREKDLLMRRGEKILETAKEEIR